MKSLLVTCVLSVAAVGVLAGQMPTYGVTVEAEKNVDFAKFKTYSWTAGQPSPIKTIDTQVMAAVDSERRALG